MSINKRFAGLGVLVAASVISTGAFAINGGGNANPPNYPPVSEDATPFTGEMDAMPDGGCTATTELYDRRGRDTGEVGVVNKCR